MTEQELVSLQKNLVVVKRSTIHILQIFAKIEQQNIPERFENFQQLETGWLVGFNENLKENDVFTLL